jgi:hypothetical protein
MKNIKAKLAAVTVMALSVVPAFAQEATTFDSTSYVASITALVAGVLAVGGAVFGLNVAIKSTKWARRAL